MTMFGGTYILKENSIKEPSMYLGANISKRSTSLGGKEYWSMGANSYVKEALRIVSDRLEKDGLYFSSKPRQPFSKKDYRSELDTSPLANDEQVTYFQNLIGILRWTIELGRVDILYEVSQLSKHLAEPRVGHLHQAIHIFSYLKAHDRSWIVFDDRTIEIIEPDDKVST